MEQNASICNHNTHKNLKLHVQFCTMNAFKKDIMNIGIKLCNKLQNNIREVEKWGNLKEIWNPTYYDTHFSL
jgi:hypothetical protein